MEFSFLNSAIRDSKIPKSKALEELKRLLPTIKEFYKTNYGLSIPRSEWRFPIDGYDLRATGNRGRDYQTSGYDYFSGNSHGGHPSLDLFIQDRNHNSLDNRSNKPVQILSIGGGIVVAVEKGWQPGSTLRGGNYIWVYDPTNELLFYYAHNRDIFVNIGEVIKPGDPIATVGRTGLNAYKKRSPTHLHLTVLRLENGYPKPENIFMDLKRIGK